MRNIIFKKVLVIGIIVLFIGMSVSSSSGNTILQKSHIPTSSGITLYVGGSGPGNYTNIQDAIDNASDGDTVYVHDDSSPYFENILINKPIILKGENKKTTVINGRKIDSVVKVKSNDVKITGFKIIKSGLGNGYAGIRVNNENNCNISDNVIKENHLGIYITDSSNCNIIGNIVEDNSLSGITVNNAPFAYIARNKVMNTLWWGIDIHSTSDSLICEMNHIERNKFTGLYIYRSSSNTIRNNNFIRHKYNVYFMDSDNIWDGNFWGRPRILPKIIFGRKDLADRFPNQYDLDRNPALKPYNILPLEV